MTVANMDFNLLDGGIEIKNTNSYEIRVTTGGEPSPTILKSNESMVLLILEPGISFYFEPYYVQPAIKAVE